MKAAFLDRDGTILAERGYYLTSPDEVEFLPGAAEVVLRLRGAGWKVFVVTNQGCVAKGQITEEELAAIHERMVMMLGAEGAQLDGIYSCPHHPEGTVAEYAIACGCRKPLPGLLTQAAAEHGVDLGESVMIGDTVRDLEAGRAAGTRTILVLTGRGKDAAAEPHGADHVAADLRAAVHLIK